MKLRTSEELIKLMRWVTAVATAAMVVAALIVGPVTTALAGPVGNAAGFEDDDGNLADDAATGIDWNSFAPLTWTGTAPYREADKTALGWLFKGLEDAQAVNTDTGFAGGTKQDDNCPSVIGSKAPNKDDLKRAYVATKTDQATGNTFLMLAWVRIPQNTTSSSAHIGFEFNKGETPCGAASDDLVQRTAGDMLIVYDFEGGATDTPVITLRRWVTSGSCEVGSKSPPCWGTATDLTAGGFAEAKVNTFGSVTDALGPAGTETLGTNEFGEAGIDLTGAGVFTANTCESFGNVFAVSRSSGNSGTAQMKDLVGPGDFRLQNCGTIEIIKHTNPANLNQDFSFTSNIAGSELLCSPDTTPASFTLNDSTTDTQTCENVPAGNYTVTEGADPAGFVFADLSCVASGTGTSASPASGNATRTASITIAGGGAVTCTYTNNQQLGAIKITKTSSKDGSGLNSATFSITKGGTPITGSPFTTANGGVICVDNLVFGDYVVTETAAPSGYAIDDTTSHTVTVDNNAKCTDTPYVGESISFSDTPLSQIRVTFHSLAGVGVTTATIQCTGDPSPSALGDSGVDLSTQNNTTGRLLNNLPPGTYSCTVVVDP